MTNTITPPTLEELNNRIAAVEELRAAWQGLPSKVPFDIELYCLYAVRDGVEKGARKRSPYWTCCECDAPLSCAVCGVEQPDDSKYFEGQARDAAQSPWMDIETAPKDGSRILIALTEGLVLEASWEACWINHWSGDPIVRTWKGDSEPVSWMPLPAPPTHNSPPEERQCQKCGCATEGEEAWVDGKIWCHPCADETSHNHGEGDPSVMPDRSGGEA